MEKLIQFALLFLWESSLSTNLSVPFDPLIFHFIVSWFGFPPRDLSLGVRNEYSVQASEKHLLMLRTLPN
jgi:hypothetical protein